MINWKNIVRTVIPMSIIALTIIIAINLYRLTSSKDPRGLVAEQYVQALCDHDADKLGQTIWASTTQEIEQIVAKAKIGFSTGQLYNFNCSQVNSDYANILLLNPLAQLAKSVVAVYQVKVTILYGSTQSKVPLNVVALQNGDMKVAPMFPTQYLESKLPTGDLQAVIYNGAVIGRVGIAATPIVTPCGNSYTCVGVQMSYVVQDSSWNHYSVDMYTGVYPSAAGVTDPTTLPSEYADTFLPFDKTWDAYTQYPDFTDSALSFRQVTGTIWFRFFPQQLDEYAYLNLRINLTANGTNTVLAVIPVSISLVGNNYFRTEATKVAASQITTFVSVSAPASSGVEVVFTGFLDTHNLRSNDMLHLECNNFVLQTITNTWISPDNCSLNGTLFKQGDMQQFTVQYAPKVKIAKLIYRDVDDSGPREFVLWDSG